MTQIETNYQLFFKSDVDRIMSKLDEVQDDISTIKTDVAVIKERIDAQHNRINAIEQAHALEINRNLDKPRKFSWLLVAGIVTIVASITSSCISSFVISQRTQSDNQAATK